MRRQRFGSTGRRGTAIAASAAVLCLGSTLAACGGPGGDGYTAVGAAGTGPTRAPGPAAPPSGAVTLVPLDGAGETTGARNGKSGAAPGGSARGGAATGTEAGGSPRPESGGAGGDGSGAARSPATGDRPGPTTSQGPGGPAGPGSPGDGDSGGARPGATGGTTDGPAPPAPSAPGSTPPAAPAAVEPASLVRESMDKRWCEQVTVAFRNTGGSPARSGTVTFGTHIIGGLGIDWATMRSKHPLPAPIGAGAVRKRTYTVCVDAWRVPLGMRVETQEVTVVAK